LLLVRSTALRPLDGFLAGRLELDVAQSYNWTSGAVSKPGRWPGGRRPGRQSPHTQQRNQQRRTTASMSAVVWSKRRPVASLVDAEPSNIRAMGAIRLKS